jgi:hypothetical protein
VTETAAHASAGTWNHTSHRQRIANNEPAATKTMKAKCVTITPSARTR